MLNAIFVIIGTIIGAGFASGKEIFIFFNVYGIYGLFGLLISELLMGFIIYKVFTIILQNNISSYSEFISKTITKSSFFNSVICNIVTIFLLISFIIMIAGFSAYFIQELHLPYILGATIISVLCFFTFLNNIDGIIKINKYFIPFLIFIILFLGIKNLSCITCFNYNSSNHNYNWFISALLYSSYNLIILFPILINLGKYLYNIKQIKLISTFTTLILLFISAILFCLLNYYFVDIQNIELPTVFIASKSSILFKYMCGLVILGAIFTTALSSGYGFLCNLNILNKRKYLFVSFCLCFFSIFLSNIGFSKLLNLLYPLLGFLRINTNCFYCIFF